MSQRVPLIYLSRRNIFNLDRRREILNLQIEPYTNNDRSLWYGRPISHEFSHRFLSCLSPAFSLRVKDPTKEKGGTHGNG